MPTTANARIDRVYKSWRVRLTGHPARFFADSAYGGRQQALAAARAWRDARWDGRDLGVKLTKQQRAEIRRSKENYLDVAERHNISPNYVHKLRREK